MTKHTPTPWEFDEACGGIWPVDETTSIASISIDIEVNGEANGRHIVKCVNMHDELVEALDSIVGLAESTAYRMDKGSDPRTCSPENAACSKAKMLLSIAKEATPCTP